MHVCVRSKQGTRRRIEIEGCMSEVVREAYYIERGGVCEYENDEKSGGSEAWRVTREEGKLVFVLGTLG